MTKQEKTGWVPSANMTMGQASAALQGYEAHVLESGRATLLERRIPFIHSEVGPVMLRGAGSNATAFLEAFAQVCPGHSSTCLLGESLCWLSQQKVALPCSIMLNTQ